jgi:four helix bundle protein
VTSAVTSDEIKTSVDKDLPVWQKGIVLVKQVYRITIAFPAAEKFVLVSQMRRAAVSIPSNIAEGQARHTKGEFVQFISHAEGSVAELDTQLIISVQLNYCTQAQAQTAFELLGELKRMLIAKLGFKFEVQL